MIETLISIIITLIVVGIVWYIAKLIIDMIPMPENIKQIVNLLMILVLVLIVIYYALLPLLPLARIR